MERTLKLAKSLKGKKNRNKISSVADASKT